MSVPRCMFLFLLAAAAFPRHAFASDEPDSSNPRCCFAEQAPKECANDPYCAGPLECSGDGGYPCGAGPDIECQNCGCCPCCAKSFACCKPGSINSNMVGARGMAKKKTTSNFRIDVRGEASPGYGKGECRPECENNCNGHGTCLPAPGSCPANSCFCEPQGFDPSQFCSTCLPVNFGSTCSSCPAFVDGKVCSGHGTCDGAGTTFGTGKCTCTTGFDVSVECASCTSTSFGKTCTSCPGIQNGKACSGHGTCDGAGTFSGTGKCTCAAGFDVSTNCATCLPLHWGASCELCPGIIDPGTTGAQACSGHGVCDGTGTTGGTGKCLCSYGWEGDACKKLYCPKGCSHGTCETLDGMSPYCACDKGWHGASCSVPKCPSPLAPGVPGCVHGNCSTTKLATCDCEPGWGDKRCSTPICTQGCLMGKGTCIAPDDCKCRIGFSGVDCGTALCKKECIFGQGDCTSPDQCTCRPNFQGVQCEVKNAACCYGTACGDAPTSCNACCQYRRGFHVPGTNIVGCAGDSYTCRNCDCKECCHGGGYCSKNATTTPVAATLGTAHPAPPKPGKCCAGHREGSECQNCVTGYYGDKKKCKQCPGFIDRTKEAEKSIVCSGHGQCSEGIKGNGTCLCEQGYFGLDCSTCDNTYCPQSCSGHGQCSCAAALKFPKCTCANGFGGETLSGYDGTCSICTRGYNTTSNCTDCSSGWFGSPSKSQPDLLRCEECDCTAQFCDDGNNGTGKCTFPSPGSSPGAGPAHVPIIAIVSASLGVLLVGAVAFFVARKSKETNAGGGGTINNPLLGASSSSSSSAVNTGNTVKSSSAAVNTGYTEQPTLNEPEAFANDGGESLEDRLARMANEM